MADKKERRKSAFAEFFQGIRRGSETDIRPAPPKGSVFGQPVDPNASTIHWLPQLTSSWLRKNALGTEGIFRVSPSQEKLDALRAEIEKQKDKIEIKSSENPHVVAGIYKLFWRELPEPLTSFAAYDTFLNIGLDANATDAERISAMRRALGALPPGVLAHVEHLADFLHACSKNDANRMGVMNLALIFAPLFFRAKVEEIKKMMREAPVVNMLTELLIGNKEDLFKTVLLPNPPPKAGDGPMGYQIRKLTRSNTASSASELSLVKTPSSTSVSADAVPPLNVEAADKDKDKEKDKDKDARSRSTTSGAMHSPVPQQRQLILSEARRANRRSVAVMSTSSQDTILQTSSSHPHPSVHTHFADVKSPRDAALLSSSSAHPAGASANGASANGYASKADASAPLSPMRSRATVHSTPRDTSPRGPDARPQATSPPARPSVSVRPESPRGSASGAYAPSRPTHAPRPESPRSSGPGATVTSPASARRSEAGMSPRSSVAGAPPGASAPMSPSRTGAMDVPRSSPPTAPLPSSPPPKSTQLGGSGGTGNAHAKPAPPNTSPPRRRKMSQPDVPVLVQNTPENLETRITALARGFRATLQDRPSTEEVLALAKLLSAAQKGLMGTHLEPTMYISKPTATSAAALSAELSMLRDRAVDGWEELTLRTAAKAKGAKGGTEADLHALSGVLKLLQFYQRTV